MEFIQSVIDLLSNSQQVLELATELTRLVIILLVLKRAINKNKQN